MKLRVAQRQKQHFSPFGENFFNAVWMCNSAPALKNLKQSACLADEMLASTDENMRHGKFSSGTREWFNVKNLLSLFDSAALWTNLPTSF
jgi:hypothetical protein